ncbi:unnamed protein product [Closterium sp. NIES-65]|nr:unnamed protein product [Closterium sp. NIES-65]CAI6008034.1 unnamed protein product [Closterium sp. NIES-65]
MAQAALTALDTWTARDWRKEERQWREELRRWRADDVAFRAEERRFKAEERMFRTVRHRCASNGCAFNRWRHEIMQQRHVDNAMHLWDRTKECNRRSVEEKAEHMRAMAWLAAIVGGFTMTAPVEAMAWLAAIVGGFTMTAPVEFTYSDPDAPMPSLMVVAAMIAVFVLGAVLRMGKLYVHEREEEEFLASARYFALNRAAAGGNRTTVAAPPAALRSFDRFWDLRCESDWRLTFRLFSAGITFFFPLLATMAFLKFHPNIWIPSIFSSVLLVALIQWYTPLNYTRFRV